MQKLRKLNHAKRRAEVCIFILFFAVACATRRVTKNLAADVSPGRNQL